MPVERVVVCTLVTGVLATCMWMTAYAAEEALWLAPGPQLFVDDYLVAGSTDLISTIHQPRRLPQPVLPKAEPWHEQPLFYLTVLHDPTEPMFQAWYNLKNPSGGGPYTCYAYAESEDGIHWQRPDLGLVDVGGSKDNNLFKVVQAFGLGFVDDGPRGPDPARRYKMAYYRLDEPPGMYVAFSPDGLRFTDYEENPVLTDLGDIIDGCWDPVHKRYILCFKAHSVPADGYEGSTPNAPEGYRRLVGESTSQDFIHWQRPWRIVVADPQEPGMWEFYGMVPRLRGELYIGFLRVLRDDLPAQEGGPTRGIGWTELCSSRDGEHWTRYRDQPFLDRNPEPGTWDRAMAWVADCVAVGDEEYVYYGGYSEGHKVGDRQVGLAKLRRNGFVSRDAGSERGYLRTPLLRWPGLEITVNAQVEGEIRVRVLDDTQKAVPGFDWDDCEPIRGDSVSHLVRWEGSLRSLHGKPVRLEFALRKAELYGFELLG